MGLVQLTGRKLKDMRRNWRKQFPQACFYLGVTGKCNPLGPPCDRCPGLKVDKADVAGFVARFGGRWAAIGHAD